MKETGLRRYRPFLAVGIVYALITVVDIHVTLPYEYDDGGMGTLLFFTGQVFFLPYRLALNLLAFLGDPVTRTQEYLAVLIVLVPFVGLDWMFGRGEQ